MTASWVVYACLGLGLSSALVGGVFQSFSDFVMRGLLQAEPAGGMESMQQLNRTVPWWNHVRKLGSVATALCFLLASVALH